MSAGRDRTGESDVRTRLLERISRDGPVPFEVFMEEALYGPGGFFAGEELRSTRAGDFLTSPEVSPLFGETLAVFVDSERERLGRPEPFHVIEAGAGSGSLLGPLLSALGDPVEAWAVETAPAARRALAPLLSAGRVVENLDDLPDASRGVLIANELLDNLAVAMAVRTGAGWEERWVGAEGDELTPVAVAARPEVAAWADRFGGPVPAGGIVEVQTAAGEWVGRAVGHLSAGALVVIDYGDTAEGLTPRRAAGTLRTYRAHHLGPDPLAEPGRTDITADVNFTAVEAAARAAGAVVDVYRQDDFLASLGLRDRLTELRRTELELARAGEVMERLRMRSLVTEAETLLHPRGLGDFRVLVARVG